MRRIAILGSTGSIGENALRVVRHLPGELKIEALSTNANVGALLRQIKEFSPQSVCVQDKEAALRLQRQIGRKKVKIFTGESGMRSMLALIRPDEVLLAIAGSAALTPLLAAIENTREIALANKEALVMAGPIVTRKAQEKNTRLIPVDSEQSAIWQCLQANERKKIKRLYLTASGGALRNTPKKDFCRVSLQQVLRHPRWKMGKKITVDSATLMNKGLEVLEAIFLFGVEAPRIEVLIHPEAIIHSMVEFIDGVVLAQLSVTDMRVPIQYALTYPRRLAASVAGIDFVKLGALNFSRPDFAKFPCLKLSYQAARELGSSPCALNAANEVSVEEFLGGGLKFAAIPRVIEKVLAKHHHLKNPTLAEILRTDAWARQEARRVIHNLN
jgi:1-deoxy-D-xylulose-5-phosphate reductoisomerase